MPPDRPLLRALRTRRQALARLLAGGLAATLAAPLVRAQAYPTRPVRIVVPFGAGGVADLTARAVAQRLAEGLRQPVVVENRPGAGGVAAGEAVARAEPDGHTLLLMSNGTAVSAGLFRSLPFDARRDFAPVGVIGSFDLAVLAPGDSRFATLRDLVAHARAQPGRLNLATIQIGSTQHLAAELLKTELGLDFQVVPFNGTPAVLTALRGGQVDAAVEILGPMLPQITARAVRPLAVLGAQRAAALPDVMTVAESGARGFDVTSWNALAAPAATPATVIGTLNSELNKALATSELRRQLADLHVRPIGGPPERLRELLASETRRWGDVITRAGVPRQ
ncbi:tripartite tricarboxylate transporter substrate-binding protein [Ramlibacter sp.]|uniref:tripartite tricarboxylate transporter substrate-binding protein n=1 Tax=Ramlibacter sp. TaxID=1917967 RepID=UPI0035B46A99